MATQLTFVFVPLGPKGLRPQRGRPLADAEIRDLYRQLRDIKRVALALKVHERRVRPVVQDLIASARRATYAERRMPTRSTGGVPRSSLVPPGTRYRCHCCGALVVSTAEEPETTCRSGTRAPWMQALNPFTPDERMGIRRPIDTSIPSR